MTFCNCCCSEARAIYHSPVIPQTAVMFLNCGINFRSVPPLTSACCSCAFAVRWTWKYFHHWFHAMMRQFNTFLHMGPPFCPQFWIKSDFSRKGPLGTLTNPQQNRQCPSPGLTATVCWSGGVQRQGRSWRQEAAGDRITRTADKNDLRQRLWLMPGAATLVLP